MDSVARHPARYTTTVASLYFICVAGTLVASVASLVSRQTNGIISTKQQPKKQCLLEDTRLICSSCASPWGGTLSPHFRGTRARTKLPRQYVTFSNPARCVRSPLVYSSRETRNGKLGKTRCIRGRTYSAITRNHEVETSTRNETAAWRVVVVAVT